MSRSPHLGHPYPFGHKLLFIRPSSSLAMLPSVYESAGWPGWYQARLVILGGNRVGDTRIVAGCCADQEKHHAEHLGSFWASHWLG
jgi:hypothetical protein